MKAEAESASVSASEHEAENNNSINSLKNKIKKQAKEINALKKKVKSTKEKYGWKDTSVCPPQFRVCKPPKKLSSFDINDHPDIHKYILKTQLPKILDKECRKHFKNNK